MSITINGTTGVSGVDGSSTTPAFQGTDTNTGLFYGTDIVGISTGGSERVRVDANGNVGIGIASPSSYNAAGRNIVVGTTSNVDSGITIASGTTATSYLLFAKGTTGSDSYNGYIGYKQDSNYMQFNVNGGVERMRIDSSGNVLVGQTNNANGVRLAIKGSGGADDDLTFNSSSTYAEIQSFNSKPIILNRQGNEIWIGGTTDRGAFNLQCNGTGVWGAGAYTNGSDERIKQDITPLDTGLDVVAKLNPVTYKYKEDWSKDQSIQTGFIAQDLLVALEGKNYVDGIVNQSSEYMSVAYQNIIPILTKAIQEQQTIINDLKARVTALETSNV